MNLLILAAAGPAPVALGRELAAAYGLAFLEGGDGQVADYLGRCRDGAGFALVGQLADGAGAQALEAVLDARDRALDAVLLVSGEEADAAHNADPVLDFYRRRGIVRRLRREAGDALLAAAARRIVDDLMRATRPESEPRFPPPRAVPAPEARPAPRAVVPAEPSGTTRAPNKPAQEGPAWKRAALSKGRFKRGSMAGPGAKRGWKPK